jgi:hypothetical protein
LTLSELKTLLNSSGITFKYHHWDKPPTLPFGVYITPSSENFKADGKVAQEFNNVIAELYTAKKDPATEKEIKDVLDGAGIFYETNETYIESEKMYQISYEFQI